MDSFKAFRKIDNQHGMAMVTILLMIVLVTMMLMMALNISRMEINLAATNRRTTQGLHASDGGSPIGIKTIQDIVTQNALPAGYPATVVVNNATAGGNPTLPDLLEEITSGGGILADDTAVTDPDLTVTALPGQTLQVDIDYEGPASLPGSELDEFAIAYHKKTGGTGCTSGTLYNMDAVSTGVLKTKSQVHTVFYSC